MEIYKQLTDIEPADLIHIIDLNHGVKIDLAYCCIDNNNIKILKLIIDNSMLIVPYSNGRRPLLYYAIDKCNIEMVKFMINIQEINLVDLKYFYKDPNSLINFVDILINCDFNINSDVVYGCNFLTFALMNHHETKYNCSNLIYYLLDLGATIKDKEDYIFYHCTKCLTKPGTLKNMLGLLERYGIDFDIKKLLEDGKIRCSRFVDFNVIKCILDCGVDINYTNRHGFTLLHMSISHINVENVQFLIDKGIDINAINIWGRSAISLIDYQDPDIFALLLDNGARTDIIDNDGNTLLHLIMCNDVELMRLLLDNCVELINYQNNKGYTPLAKELSGIHPSYNYIKLLLEYGAYINILANDGVPLINYCYNNVDIIDLLLDYGADINSKCPDGKTIIYKIIDEYNTYSSYTDSNDCLSHVLNVGADVNMKYNKDETLLHILVRTTSDIECVKAIDKLVEYGIDINAINEDGQTALYCAIYNNYYVEIIQCLINNGADINIIPHYSVSLLQLAIDRRLTDIIQLLEKY